MGKQEGSGAQRRDNREGGEWQQAEDRESRRRERGGCGQGDGESEVIS